MPKKPKFKLKEIYPNLFLAVFSSQYEMCSTFFRLQEFYESPCNKVRGKYFTYEQGIDAYAYQELDDKEVGEFNYFSVWAGFNVPGNTINKFKKLFKHDLTEKEKNLLSQISDIQSNKKKYYVIGYEEDGDEEDLKHEIAHGLYYLNSEYKKEMLGLVNSLPSVLTKPTKEWLLKSGYCKKVLNDEIHAYYSTGIRKKMVNPLYKLLYWNRFKKFETLFNEYYKKIEE
jgi:hypothetical protein